MSCRITPVICLSNVSGENMPLLNGLLSQLPSRFRVKKRGKGGGGESALRTRKTWTSETNEFKIDSTFQVPGTGFVVAGMVTRGSFHAKHEYQMGPDKTGKFFPVVVRSIHVMFTNAETAMTGQAAAFSIRRKKQKLKATDVRKGMCLISSPSSTLMTPEVFFDFEAEIAVLHHQSTICAGYTPTIHCGSVSQAARVIEMVDAKGEPIMRLSTGDRAIVRFRFLYTPEYIQPGAIFLFREGRARGVGIIKSAFVVQDSAR